MEKNKAHRFIFDSSKGELLKILAVTAVNALIAALGVYFTLVVRDVINRAIEGDTAGVWRAAVVMVAVVALQLLLSITCRMLEEHISSRLEIAMRGRVFRALLKKDYSAVSSFHSGEVINRLFGDVSIVCSTTATLVPGVIGLLTRLVGALAAILLVDRRFAILILCGGLLMFVFARVFRKFMKRTHTDVQEAGGRLRSFVQEAMENLLVIKSFKMEEQITDGESGRAKAQHKAKMRRAAFSSGAGTGFSALVMCGYMYAVVWGAVRILSGTPGFGYGDFTAIMQLIGQIQTPFAGLSGSLSKYYSAIASAERIMELADLPCEDDATCTDVPEIYKELDLIRLQRVSFNYGKTKVFTDADAEIHKGKLTLISGASGIGKSTLIKLLMGVIRPASGEICASLSDGREIRLGSSTRGLFAYVPQGNFLMSGTIRENLLLAKPDATEEDIDKALRVSSADTFVNELRDGVMTEIGERGRGLSEGQVQRLAIARAILSGAPVLLLDEATSALDEETERAVLENIMKLPGRTCIAISHRNAAREICDCELQVVNEKILKK